MLTFSDLQTAVERLAQDPRVEPNTPVAFQIPNAVWRLAGNEPVNTITCADHAGRRFIQLSTGPSPQSVVR